MAKKISIINFKGGVGKSTLSFHFAAHLAKSNKVLLIDVDHQSSLSIVMMGSTAWESVATKHLTSNAIFQSFSSRNSRMPGGEIIAKNPLKAKHTNITDYSQFDLVPAQFELDDTEIELASTSIGGPVNSEWTKRTLVSEWLDCSGANDFYDFIIFDCPPATKLVSQNALAASDLYVIPVIPDVMSSRGVTHFRSLVNQKIDAKLEYLKSNSGIASDQVPKSYVSSTKLLGIVPFMAKVAGNALSGITNIHSQQIADLQKRWKKDMLKTVVKNLSGVAESMESGLPIWNMPSTQNIDRALPDMVSLCKELEARI